MDIDNNESSQKCKDITDFYFLSVKGHHLNQNACRKKRALISMMVEDANLKYVADTYLPCTRI